MKITPNHLPGVLTIEPNVFKDERGRFMVSYKTDEYVEAGVTDTFVQDNVSVSKKGVLRGLHLQHPAGQAKLVSVARGEVFDVCVDVRVGSPTFGQWYGEILSEDNAKQLLVPVGYAHGFCVLSDEAYFIYKCSELYKPEAQISVLWNDPQIGIPWPVTNPILAPKDAKAPSLKELLPQLPHY